MKKVLSLVLAVVLAVGLTSVAFAAMGESDLGYGTSKDKDASETIVIGNATTAKGDAAVDNSGDAGDRAPGDEIFFPLVYKATGNTLTKDDVKKAKIDVRFKVNSGSKAIDKVEIDSDKNGAWVKVVMVDPFVSVDDVDWEIEFYLTKDKTRDKMDAIVVYGNLDNSSQEADANDEYLYLENDPVVEATEYVKEIELDLGNGVSIIAKLFGDKDYYGYGDNDISTADDANMDKYTAIVGVYNQKTIGLANASNYVKFNDIDDSETYYVYNGAMEYLGTTKDKIPVATKYYVAEELLNVVGDTDDIEDDDNDIIPDDTDDTDNVDMGGDEAPANANDNPSTGC